MTCWQRYPIAAEAERVRRQLIEVSPKEIERIRQRLTDLILDGSGPLTFKSRLWLAVQLEQTEQVMGELMAPVAADHSHQHEPEHRELTAETFQLAVPLIRDVLGRAWS